MIKRCTCKNEYQDREHGKDKRVMNRCKPNDKPPVYRCTVCTKERS